MSDRTGAITFHSDGRVSFRTPKQGETFTRVRLKSCHLHHTDVTYSVTGTETGTMFRISCEECRRMPGTMTVDLSS